MKLKMLLLFAASVSSVIVLACSEVVFPTPLPTATPAPTATPIVFPTPLPTATPFSIPSPLHTATPSAIIFPTPLPTATPAPTATPVSIPSPLPTATPSVLVLPTPLPTATPAPTATPVAFPTPLPTSTPVPTAFAGIGDLNVVRLSAIHAPDTLATRKHGVGFAFESPLQKCSGEFVCILTAYHVVKGSKFLQSRVRGGENRIFPNNGIPLDSDIDLDISVIQQRRVRVPGISLLQFAGPYDRVDVNDAVRVVTTDPHFVHQASGERQRVIDGIVSDFENDGDDFVLTAEIFPGNSGAVVLNTDMEVVGMIIRGYPRPPTDKGVVVGASSRSLAVHVDAIRGKLCEWGYLTGRDCD